MMPCHGIDSDSNSDLGVFSVLSISPLLHIAPFSGRHPMAIVRPVLDCWQTMAECLARERVEGMNTMPSH